jgi:ABC-type antimicrobial peptide transport system permease subunit
MKKNHTSPPAIFLYFFRWFCHPELKNYIEGDLMELYDERLKASGKRRADLKFIIDVVLLFRPGIIKPSQQYYSVNNYTMFKSYFKIGWRNLLRDKGYSMINIGGLAAGMAMAILIGLWIYDELSFSQYHENYDTIVKIYRMETREGQTEANTTHVTGLGTLLKTEYSAHFKDVVMVRANLEERVLAVNDKKFTQQGYFMQPGGGEMFTLKMKYGVRDGLKEMKSILLSESLAKKLFGDIDPVNHIVSMDAKWDLKVTGVYEDLPKNSEFNEASYFAPLDLYLDGWASLNAWDNYHMIIYAQIHPEGNIEKISSIIKDVTLAHIDEETARSKPEIFLHPMRKWHLFSEFENGFSVTSARMRTVWYYGIIGGFVLFIACINFMNLSTARSERRAKEVGIRKSIGSQRSQLVQQFYSESLLVTLLAFVLAFLIVQLTLPWFNSMADKTVSLPLENVAFWAVCVGFTLLTGLLAGSYPAIYLSSFKPVKILKGTFKGGRFSSLPRKVLVVVQFTVSICLIVGTMIVYHQIEFAKNRPVGYTREGLISMRAASPEFKGKYQVLRNELKQTGMVEEIAEANYPVTSTKGWNGGFSWQGQEFEPSFNTIFVTHEYGKTLGWEFLQGRDFSREFASDTAAIVINESALRLFGLKNPIGESLKWAPGENERGTFKIIGVVKDMIKGSPYEETFPSVIFLSQDDMQWLYIKVKPTVAMHQALPKMQAVFANLVPSAPFDFTFAEQAYEEKFLEEERVSKLATLFSALAILISCLGLFGLASFVAEQRTKEIGIRKVLGASISQLWQLLSKDFVVLVVISCVVAIPISFYFMNSWLLQYQYRVDISWKTFAIASLAALVITLFTVSFQTIKAAITNPVKSLRSE